jgi:peptidoglycan/xylan/chitin deacetylase (PgdA/CDA1 family)
MRFALAALLFTASTVTGLTQEPTPTQALVPEPTPTQASVSEPTPPKPATYTAANVDGPFIAMTFDDGPSPENTPRLLKMLRDRNIKATFFLIGQNAAEYPDVVRQILADGHEVANHSWSHPVLSRLSDERVSTEITKCQEAIRDASGATPTLLRPPYGALSARQRDWIQSQFGLNIILWSVDPLDWRRPGAAVITNRIIGGAHPGAIILAHDIHKQTVDAMPATLDSLLQKGYQFVTVTELLAMNKPKPSPTPAAVAASTPATNGPGEQRKPTPAKAQKRNPKTDKPEAQTQASPDKATP